MEPKAPKIHDPADLTPMARLAIERKQFSQLLPDMHAQYLRWQLECDDIYSDTPEGVERVTFDLTFTIHTEDDEVWKEMLGYRISRHEWASLITSDVPGVDFRLTTNQNLMDAYVTMMCNYVNGVRKSSSLLLSGKKDGKRGRSRSPPNTPNKLPIRVRSPPRGRRDDPQSNMSPSCKVISGQDLFNCFDEEGEGDLQEDALDKVLASIDCTAQNFRELDYLFVPILDTDYTHAILIGLAPRQRYAFIIDSDNVTFRKNVRPTRWWARGLTSIIHKLDPTIKSTKKNVPVADRTKYWYLFGQYPTRSKTDDRSPDGPQQVDRHNCGLFAMTSAFCLAFGYDLLCWEQSKKPGGRTDLDKWKKARVAFEMETEGFAAKHDFDYELLQIPQEEIKPVSRQNEVSISPQSSVSGDGSMRPYQDVTPSSGGDSMDEDGEEQEEEGEEEVDEDEDEDDSDEDYDMEEARMIETPNDNLGYITDEGDEGSDGEIDDAEDDPSRAFLTASEALAREHPKVTPMSNDLPWPAQIPAQPKGYFARSGFVYPAPDVNFQPKLKYSKRELKKACRDFPLVGWKRWSRQSQPLFLQWMLNEMAATMSLIHNDPIEPLDGLARGYERWKQQHAEKALAVAMKERAARMKSLRDRYLLRERRFGR